MGNFAKRHDVSISYQSFCWLLSRVIIGKQMGMNYKCLYNYDGLYENYGESGSKISPSVLAR